MRCVSPCYRNRAVCLSRRKLILRSTIYRAIYAPRRKIVTIYYRAICLQQCWDTVTKYHSKNRGVGNRTIIYRKLRYRIPYRLKNRGTPKPYHFLRFSKALPCRALIELRCISSIIIVELVERQVPVVLKILDQILDINHEDGCCCIKKNQNAPRPSEHPPVREGEMSKRLGGIKGCKCKTSSWH